MLVQTCLEGKCARFSLKRQVFGASDVVRGAGVYGPDAGVVVSAAGAEVADVGGEEHAGYVGGVGLEGGYSNEGGDVAVLEHAPDIDVALV